MRDVFLLKFYNNNVKILKFVKKIKNVMTEDALFGLDATQF